MQNFIGNRVLGSVKRTQEIQLGAALAKKVGTIDYDFPGAAYYVGARIKAGAAGNEIGIVPKNTIYFRQNVTPYKYQPLCLLKVLDYTIDGGGSDVIAFEDSDAYMLGYGETPVQYTHNIMLWDDSQSKWSDFESDAVTIRKGAITYSAALTNVAASDLISVGSGVADMHNWVIFDEEVNLRSTAKPAAISADIIASLIYEGRINADALTQWPTMTANLKAKFREQCGRLFTDTL